MSTNASLGNLLDVTASYNYYVMQQNYWAAKYEANSEKLQKQVGYEEKWESAYDKAMEGNSECKVGGTVYVNKDQGSVSEEAAEAFANAKVSKYDQDLSIELAELDIEYDTQKQMYETLTAELKAQQEAAKPQVAQSAQETHMVSN